MRFSTTLRQVGSESVETSAVVPPAKSALTKRITSLCLGSGPLTWVEIAVSSLLLALLAGGALATHVSHGYFYTDDWAFARVFDRNKGFGLIHAFASATPGRPVLAVYFPTVYAMFGLHPALHLAWAAALTVIVAVGVFAVLRELGLPTIHSWMVGGLLVVFPFSDSTKLWATASVIQFSLALYLAGVLLALRAFRLRGRRVIALHGVSVGMYALSIMTYEATLGLILASIGLYAVRTRCVLIGLRWVADVAATFVVVFTVTNRTAKTVHGLGDELHHSKLIFQQGADLLVRSAFPWGPSVTRDHMLLLVAAVSAIGLVTFFAAQRDTFQHALLKHALLMIGGGTIAIAAGYLAYVPADDYYSPYGTEGLNRVNAVASVGYVVLAYGLALTIGVLLGRTVPRGSVIAAFIAVGLLSGYTRILVKDESLWDHAATGERRVLSQISALVPQSNRDARIYVWRSRTEITSQLPIFNSSWDLPGALSVKWHDPAAVAFPVLATTGFNCGDKSLYPTNGLYGASEGARYGRAIFVDSYANTATTVTSKTTCQSLVRHLSKPQISIDPLPKSAVVGDALQIDVRVMEGYEPLVAAPVTLRVGDGSTAQTCEAVTLPSGVATCVIGLPTGMNGKQKISADFPGTPTLEPASAAGLIDVTP
jgi:hypothetical protein